MEVEPFILFGTDHLLAILAVILTSIFLPIFLKKTSSKTKNWFGYILASILILNECVKPYYHNHFFRRENLTKIVFSARSSYQNHSEVTTRYESHT